MDVLVVDDEALARERLVRMISRMEECEVVAQAAGADEALQAIKAAGPDVVLMDISMPGEDGLSAAKRISTMEDPPAVVFCTAYDKHAVEAFEAQAVGYLLKPVRQEQLEQVLQNARKLNRMQIAALDDMNKADRPNARKHISAKTRRGVELIPLEDIFYFLADQKYVTVYHRGGETLIDDTLKELESEFEASFIRIHRNALVARSYIEGMERAPEGHYVMRLRDSEEKPVVSRRHVSKIRAMLAEM
ncbi:response regulator transcription factor [Pseudoteredinibacter isoporae]|nr:LytTR family DNA-binding domain-containing protein [Pseudoteredinibacter isoporae]NHO85503.1 response regulator transcription factor [Pseudoteredinibacter isoporae]NIB26045.1 response regulator transcription factor [Pseudoteredinibacter isoporae]